MDCRLVLTVMVLCSSWASLGASQSVDTEASLTNLGGSLAAGVSGLLEGALAAQASSSAGAGAGAGGTDLMPCMQKLIPCQPYLHSPSPPLTCCAPLREMVANESQCLCGIFGNPAMLKSLNLTTDEALKLPKACGADPDVSLCKNASSPTSQPPSPSTPLPNNDTSSSSGTDESSTKSAGSATTHVGLWSLIVCLVGFPIVSVI